MPFAVFGERPRERHPAVYRSGRRPKPNRKHAPLLTGRYSPSFQDLWVERNDADGYLLEAIQQLWTDSGFSKLFNFANGGWKNLIMIAISCVLIYLAIKKQYEPLLLLPIAFGMLLVNLPSSEVMNSPVNSLVALSPEELEHFFGGTVRPELSGF